jgi:hypothetical protein
MAASTPSWIFWQLRLESIDRIEVKATGNPLVGRA